MKIFWLILCLLALPVSAEVFTYVDAQGNRVYTDQPRGNAKRVPIATSNRMSANPTVAAPINAAKKSRNNRCFTTTCCASSSPSRTRPFAAARAR